MPLQPVVRPLTSMMTSMPILACIAFWLVAVVMSLLYGRNAIAIFTDVAPDQAKERKAWQWHQRWLNFVGSMFGWAALWLLLQTLCRCSADHSSHELPPLDLRAAALAFVAFVGITGHLPFAVVGLISGASTLSSKAGELIKALFPKPPTA